MLEEIEAKLNIQFPQLYRDLFSDGMLDLGEQGPGWHENVYPRIRAKPPLLAFAGDFRLIPPVKVIDYTKTINVSTREFHAIVPIGRNGAGELFCLLFISPTSIDSVCKINKRTGACVKLAKDISDFIFRELLGAAVQINEEDLESEGEHVKDLSAMLQSHKKYMEVDRLNILEKIYSMPIEQQDDDELGMISLDEYYRILDNNIAFDGLNQRFTLPLGEV